MAKKTVMKPGTSGAFRRSVKDKKGKTVKVLVFEAGKPQVLSGAELAAVENDIGKALVELTQDMNGVLRYGTQRGAGIEHDADKDAAIKALEANVQSLIVENAALRADIEAMTAEQTGEDSISKAMQDATGE